MCVGKSCDMLLCLYRWHPLVDEEGDDVGKVFGGMVVNDDQALWSRRSRW